MAAELTAAEYAILIILQAEGREVSNTELNKVYETRLVSPAYEKLNAAGYVVSETKHRPYRHAITSQGVKLLSEPLTIGDAQPEGTVKRSPREKQLWAAVVAQQNAMLRSRVVQNGATATVSVRPTSLDERIRAGYAQLAGAPGEWVNLTDLRPLLADVSKADLDRALEQLLDAPDVWLEPEPFGHRIGEQERRAAVHIGGEDRHKMAIGVR